jgi:hypothetical protein
MGLYHMGPPKRLVRLLKERLAIELFVETGTYYGNTSAWAAEYFTNVITFEASPHFAEMARSRFSGRNVRVIEGSSATELKPTLEANPGNAIFWLDAHWCGGMSAGNTSECPFFDEMAAINSRTNADVILLDDARYFLAPPPAPHDPAQWPTLSETVSKLENGGRRYVVAIDDIFLAVPTEQRLYLVDQCQLELKRRARRSFWAAKIAKFLKVPWQGR